MLRDDPFTQEDAVAWREDAAGVLEKYFPGARDLVANYTLDLPGELTLLDITKEKDVLGYQPRYNFFTFLQDLADHDRQGDGAEWLERP